MKSCQFLVVILSAWLAPAPTALAQFSAREVFDKRLLPIFKSPNPSSCVQCHLAGVDLKNYIRPSHEQTFVSLRDQGLIDLEAPEKSKILQLIRMGEEDKAGAALIHQKNRRAEYQAFVEWIKRSAGDAKLRALPKASGDELAKPTRPNEVIRHARKDRLLESFENTIWALRFRCMSCHIEGTDENRKFVEKHGQRVAWFKKGGPRATLDYLISTKRLIDVEDPKESLLLLKPLNEVEHGGGKKMLKGDQGYQLFLSFLEDFARIKKDQYADARALPRANDTLRFGSEAWFKITNTLPAWGDRILQVDIHAWDAAAGAWEAKPIATSDRLVWGKGKLWQHNLTLLADKGSRRALSWKESRPALPRGKYLVKVYVDAAGRLQKDAKATLGPADFVGQAEVTSAWPEGYGRMTVVDAAAVRKN